MIYKLLILVIFTNVETTQGDVFRLLKVNK